MAKGRIGTLIKIATVAGPTIYTLVTKYGPELRRLKDNNPEAFDRVTGTVKSMTGIGKNSVPTRGVKGAEHRIKELREQVTYLRDSADDAYERDRATLWGAQLDKLEGGLRLVRSMGEEARAAELERVNARLDRLAGDVLSAYIDELDEDARKGTAPRD